MTGRHRKAYRDLKKLDKPTLHMLLSDAAQELVDPDTTDTRASDITKMMESIEEEIKTR